MKRFGGFWRSSGRLRDAWVGWKSLGLSAAAVVTMLGPGMARAEIVSPQKVMAAWAKPKGHPLIGKIYITRTRRTIDGIGLNRGARVANPVVVAMGLKGASFVLLGEVHDNAEHHLFRAGVLDQLAERSPWGRKVHPPVVSEHIRAEQVPALDRFRALVETGSPPPTADDLMSLLAWDKSGWPEAAMFRPLYAAVIEARLPLRAGDPSRDLIRAVARTGKAALPEEDWRRLGVDKPLPSRLDRGLAEELLQSHCGMLPATAIPNMALAQRYRDAVLADALIEAERSLGPAVLLAGNGHVRKDRGVPYMLAERAPGKKVVAVMMIEVVDGKRAPEAYVARSPAGEATADVIVFTPRATRSDPCEGMKAQVERSKKDGKAPMTETERK